MGGKDDKREVERLTKKLDAACKKGKGDTAAYRKANKELDDKLRSLPFHKRGGWFSRG